MNENGGHVNNVRVAIVQVCATDDLARNLDEAARGIAEAADRACSQVEQVAVGDARVLARLVILKVCGLPRVLWEPYYNLG